MTSWRGWKSLVQDAVEKGTVALEQAHKEAARRPFAILESVPGVAAAAKGVHEIHDAALANTYGMIRLVNRVVGETVDAAADALRRQP